MKSSHYLLVGVLTFLGIAFGSASADAIEPIQEPIINGLTHPTAFTLNAGEWMVGGSLAYGILDRFQIGTSPLLNIILLNVSAKAQLVHFPQSNTTLGVTASFFTPGPLVTDLLPFLAPATAIGVGAIGSIRASDQMTLHTGFSWLDANFGGIPLFSMSGPLFLGLDYKLSPGIRLLSVVNAWTDNVSTGAGVMMRGPFESTFQLGGLASFNLMDDDNSPSLQFVSDLFWRF